MKPLKEQALRCAIYTRKSSEEGLEQDFNSLHAQREACEAYIRSQQGEGWRLRKTPYNDGGLSGATMERPALKQLLTDIEEGLVDVVVVYKVDRLTRSQYVSRLIRLAFLAPEMVERIVAGRQPPELTAQALRTGCSDLPVDWATQKRALGSAQPA